MSDIPKRIYARQGNGGGWFYSQDEEEKHSHSFIRQDIVDGVVEKTSALLTSSRLKAYDLGVAHGKASLLSELSEQVMEAEIAKLGLDK